MFFVSACFAAVLRYLCGKELLTQRSLRLLQSTQRKSAKLRYHLAKLDQLSEIVLDLVHMFSLGETGFSRRQHIALASEPNIKRRQQEYAHYQVSDQATDDDDRERSL